jgi:deazaflavin-dependent oxidoreductase (nitroreductase family)
MTEPLYRRPTWIRTRLVNPLARALVLRGRAGRDGEQNLMRVLRVPGRRTGRPQEVPVRVATWRNAWYIVSLLGDAQWARNLRAAGTAELLVGNRVEPVVGYEIQGAEKVAFLDWYCRQPEHRLSVRAGLKVAPGKLTAAGTEWVVRQYPIFRLNPAPAGAPAGA